MTHNKKPENIQALKEYAEWLPQYEGKWVAESEGYLMADVEMVEVVIKMPKEKYDSICNMYGTFPAKMKEWGLAYIKNGTLLPKGHDVLIDLGELKKIIQENDPLSMTGFSVRFCDIYRATPIIEADNSESEG